MDIIFKDFQFQKDYMQAALMVSLLSVWLLVGLFYYLNRYTRREYFTIWTAAWLFYALWLTLIFQWPEKAQTGNVKSGIIFLLEQSCVAISAVFLLWGSLRFLELPIRQLLFGLFMLFVLVWTWASTQVSDNPLQVQLPVFILLGLGSIFAGVSFFRLRRKMPFVGAGMLSLGFLLWGLYLASYPVSREYENLFNAGFFVAAVLQLFIAVSMIVLVLEEVRYKTEKVLAEIAEVRSEKEALQLKVISTEEQVRNLYDQVRLTNSAQQAYAELRRTQQVVVQQERLRALGQMASGIAHDINNALSPIVAYSDLLIGTLPNLAETSRRQLGHIQKAAQDITKIVERMREFYRKRSATEQLSEVNVNQVVEDAVELTRPRWRDLPQRQGISIHILRELEPNLPLLLSDPGELREALINLIFNAVDALPHGGTITFVTRSSSGPASEPSGVPGRRIQIEVRDNGIGMDEKTRRHCLEPFFSTKAQRGGTGLGLAMVYGIMQRHEGTIDIDSTLGRGTCIRLTFPILEKTPQPVTITASPDEQKRSLRVLCIDDEPMVRQLLVDCLKRYNHKVSVASSGRHGLEMFHSAIQNKKPYDAVITDLGMPEVDGHQVARAVKAKSPDTPVIMMTGWGSVMKDDGETTPHVDALVGKPPSMEELNKLLLHITATKKHTIAQGAEVSLAPTLP